MKYDCVIIGGGIAGITCGIKCASEGLSCIIISSGMSALHFSSGSIDLLGYYPDHSPCSSPFGYMKQFITSNPEHPYSKCGMCKIDEALKFFKGELSSSGLELFSNGEDNHYHVTALGTLRPTFYSQKTVYNARTKKILEEKPDIAVLGFEGFRDFYPAMVTKNLIEHKLFNGFHVVTGSLSLPGFKAEKNRHEFRSIDIARMFESPGFVERISDQIMKKAGTAKIVGIPAVMGLSYFNKAYDVITEKTSLYIYEIPTLPPSILGMRIDDALKSRFAALGGVYVPGDKVVGGKITNGRLEYIYTINNGNTKIRGDNFVLCTGSFFSGGITSGFNVIKEPVFDLSVVYDNERSRWYSDRFLSPESHPYLEYGVDTNERLNPSDRTGQRVENLFCSGAVLSHYNPVKEGTGSGVAISTGFYSAEQIIERCGKM